MALLHEPSLNTCVKFWILGYDAQIKEEYENKVTLAIFAEDEEKAIEKAKKLVPRNNYDVYEVQEVVDTVKD